MVIQRPVVSCSCMRGGLVAMSVAALACAHHRVYFPDCLHAGEPCSIGDAALSSALASCAVHREPAPPPPPEALRVDTASPEIVVEEGAETYFAIQMTNVTARPLDLDLTFECNSFEMSTYAEGSETPLGVSIRNGCPPIEAPVCNAGNTVWVTLAPNGTLHKFMLFTAGVPRRTFWAGECQDVLPRELAPGRYVVRVLLPLYDEVPGSPGIRNPRHLDVPVIVTPFKELELTKRDPFVSALTAVVGEKCDPSSFRTGTTTEPIRRSAQPSREVESSAGTGEIARSVASR